jgi:hypothetical protein
LNVRNGKLSSFGSFVVCKKGQRIGATEDRQGSADLAAAGNGVCRGDPQAAHQRRPGEPTEP